MVNTQSFILSNAPVAEYKGVEPLTDHDLQSEEELRAVPNGIQQMSPFEGSRGIVVAEKPNF